jgi:uncharacterized cupin superfamily protein
MDAIRYEKDGKWEPLELELTLIEGDPDVLVQMAYDGEAEGRPAVGFGKVTPSTFEITLEWDESINVLEGAATVVVDGDESLDLSPGTAVFLKRGSVCRWTVHEHFVEFFVLST